MASQDNSDRIKVSIVIPTFNRQDSLIKTLNSLFNQTFPQENFEIIIVDGSADNTGKIIQEIQKNHQNLRYIKQVDKGASSARNQGITNSKSEIVGFTDDDCIVDPVWIEQAFESMQNTKFCGVQGITLPEMKIQLKNKIFDYADVATYTGNEKFASFPTCNIFYRKKFLEEISCFDEKLTYAEDDDLAFRLIKKGYKIYLNKKMIVYHEVRYCNLVDYISKRLKRQESVPLFVKKNPEYRDRLFLKIFSQTSHVYPIFAAGSVLMFIMKLEVSIPLFFTIFAFLATRVFIDRNYIMMPIRILFFWRYFIIDIANIYYLVKGSIKYRSLLI